jgi:hypothetical protein
MKTLLILISSLSILTSAFSQTPANPTAKVEGKAVAAKSINLGVKTTDYVGNLRGGEYKVLAISDPYPYYWEPRNKMGTKVAILLLDIRNNAEGKPIGRAVSIEIHPEDNAGGKKAFVGDTLVVDERGDITGKK